MQFKDITQGKQHFNIKYIHKCHFRTQQRKQLFILKLVHVYSQMQIQKHNTREGNSLFLSRYIHICNFRT